jgi:hypothetical protein
MAHDGLCDDQAEEEGSGDQQEVLQGLQDSSLSTITG